ncbi:MAG: hypothetical protein AAB550_03105 [Patescibacteria group bacterium]
MKKTIFIIGLNLILIFVYYVSMAKVSTERIVTISAIEEENQILKEEIAQNTSISALTKRAEALGMSQAKIEYLTPTAVAKVNPQ